MGNMADMGNVADMAGTADEGRVVTMRRNPLRPGGVPSLPEYFPGANERVSGIEIASEQEDTSLVEDHPDASFLETGRIRISLPSDPEDGTATP